MPFNTSNLSAFPQFALVLGIMVFIHEAGHFLVAKLFGVRVEAFALGFGKRLFGYVHNGTDYRVNLFPVGGYVKFAGAELTGETSDDPDELQNHPRWQRTLIVLAGPVANFILAFALLAVLYMTHYEVPTFENAPVVADYVSPGSAVGKLGMLTGDRLVRFDTVENPTWRDVVVRSHLNMNQAVAFSFEHGGVRNDARLTVENKGRDEDFDFFKLGLVPVMQATPVEVSAVDDPTTPAARAGLKAKDLIAGIDGVHPHSVFALIAYLQDAGGKPAMLSVDRPGAAGALQVPVTPYFTDTREGKGYRLGFRNASAPVQVTKLGFVEAAKNSYEENLKNSRLIFTVLHRLFTRQVSVKSLSSPIGMGVQVHQAFEEKGPAPIVETMAMISLNLGIFNLLPIPILDGGMILFLAIESFMRRDVSPQVKERVFQVAFVCIVLFAAIVIFNDLTKLLPIHRS